VQRAAAESLPSGPSLLTVEVKTSLATEVRKLFGSRKPSCGAVADRVGELAGRLAGADERDRVIAGLAAPSGWFVPLPDRVVRAGPPGLVELWAMHCWAAEALWRVTRPDAPPGSTALGDVDRDRLWPLAARARFLVLSEPFRHRDEQDNPWTADGTRAALRAVFGQDTWHLLVARAQEARQVWRGCLDGYASHHFLATAEPGQLEAELDLVVFRDSRRRGVLVLAGDPDFGHRALPAADDRLVELDVAERHYLPRFRIVRTASAAWAGSQRDRRARGPLTARLTLTVLAAASAAAAVISVAVSMRAAVLLAVCCYLLVGVGVLRFGRAFAMPLLLRWPASAALGLLVLVGLNGDWWTRTPMPWATVAAAAGALVAVAYAYLVIEARNHGVGGTAAPARALAVLGVGALHAVLVATIGLTLVLPVFAEQGALLTGVLTGHDRDATLQVVGLAAAWCLAAGVFSQILWDDQPITAPLAHSRWRADEGASR
jgi:hypothetical protein